MAEISPGVGEVVVKVLYAGVNGGCETFRARGDHIFAANRNSPNGFPLGAEGSGIVVALGSGVTNVAIGDHVSFLGSAFAEYVRLRADGLIKVPKATAETAALRISGVTACGVLHTGQAKPGDTVLITAAAGGSGHFAVQLAKQAGCTVVGTCSSEAKARLLCGLGCDTIINVAKRDLASAIRRRHPAGVDVLLDHVGGPLLAAGLGCLKEGGRAVLVGYISQYPHNGDAAAAAAAAAVEESCGLNVVETFWGGRTAGLPGGRTVYGNIYPPPEQLKACKERVYGLHAAGRLRAVVDRAEFRGLGRAADAVEHMLSGASAGKVVLALAES